MNIWGGGGEAELKIIPPHFGGSAVVASQPLENSAFFLKAAQKTN